MHIIIGIGRSIVHKRGYFVGEYRQHEINNFY